MGSQIQLYFSEEREREEKKRATATILQDNSSKQRTALLLGVSVVALQEAAKESRTHINWFRANR